MGINDTNKKENWLVIGGQRAKKRAKTTSKEIPWYEVENPAANDGIYFDKVHATWEVRQYGKPAQPVSGKLFNNVLTGMKEIYDDLSKPPVVSFKGDSVNKT
jgi:hypothetical protein